MQKIAIFGVPRSGTSWLGQIFNSHPYVAFRLQPLFSYTHKGRLNENSSAQEIDDFFIEILNSSDSFTLMQDAYYHKSYPNFIKSAESTHIVFKETRYLNIMENMLSKCPQITIIGIVRDPRSVLASWVEAPKEFDAEWDIIKEWRWAPKKNAGKAEEFYGYEKWKQSARDFLRFAQDFPEQFRLVQYERLVNDPLTETHQLFQFCGLDVETQTTRFISDSRKRHDDDAYSVYRSKAGGQRWMEVLPYEITQTILADLDSTSLADFLCN